MTNEVSKVYTDIAELLNVARAKLITLLIQLWLKLIGKSVNVLLKKNKPENLEQNMEQNSLKIYQNI